MKLYKLLIIKLFLYGIPTIPATIAYQLMRSYMSDFTFSDTIFVVIVVYILVFLFNTGIFESDYKRYLREDDKDKDRKNKDKDNIDRNKNSIDMEEFNGR